MHLFLAFVLCFRNEIHIACNYILNKHFIVLIIRILQFAENWIRSYVESNGNPGENFQNKLPHKDGDSNRNNVILENYQKNIAANVLLFHILPETYKKGFFYYNI